MKKLSPTLLFILLGITILYFGSCYPKYDDNKTDERSNYKVNEQLKIPPIDSSVWSYHWYMIKHKDGHFENTLGESITQNDTMHLIHNSNCQTYNEGLVKITSYLKFAKATLNNDTLQIKIYDESASNWEHLNINLFKQKFETIYKTNYVFPHEGITYEFKDKSLIINTKPPFQKGDIIKGLVEIKLLETIDKKDDEDIELNKIISGSFEVIVE